jgi:hypothetical protein
VQKRTKREIERNNDRDILRNEKKCIEKREQKSSLRNKAHACSIVA